MKTIKNTILWGLVIAIPLLTLSCKKEGCMDPMAENYSEKANKDNGSCTYPEATLEIISPKKGEVFNYGETVKINAVATNFETMHGWEVYIYNKTTSDTVVKQIKHDHNTKFTIKGEWVNTVTVDSEMELGVRVPLDHDGNEIKGKVNFECRK